MSITDDTLRIVRKLRADTADLTDAQARDLIASWARAWDEVAGDLDAALQDLAAAAGDGRITRAMISRSARLTRALGVIAGQLDTLAADAEVRVTGDLPAMVELAGATQARLIGSQLPAGSRGLVVAWDQVSPGSIDALVRRLTKQVHASTRPLSTDADRAVRRELIRGLASGRNPRDVARRILARTEGGFNGGLTRALTISRTEMLDAHRAGARIGQLANRDVLQGWVWTAELDRRTCPACFAMHGTEHLLEEDGPEGHQNCRCARTPQTVSWRDLGLDLDEPASVLPDAAEVFDGLDPADQLAVLGRGRYDAWTRGDLPLSGWAVKRSNPGWRDSYVPAKVPASV